MSPRPKPWRQQLPPGPDDFDDEWDDLPDTTHDETRLKTPQDRRRDRYRNSGGRRHDH